MVSDDGVAATTARVCRVGRPSASMYFFTGALWIPNSRSIARSDIPPCAWLSESPSIAPSEGTSVCAQRWLWACRVATLSVIIPPPFSPSALESSGSRAAVQRSPRPWAPEVGTRTLAEAPWPFRRNTGLGGASWDAMMRPSWRTDRRPSSLSRTSTSRLRHSWDVPALAATAGYGAGISPCCPWPLFCGA